MIFTFHQKFYNRLLMNLDCFEHKCDTVVKKWNFKKLRIFSTIFDHKDLQRFVNKKWIEVYDQSEKKLRP